MAKIGSMTVAVLATAALMAPESVAQTSPVSEAAQLAREALVNGCMASLVQQTPLSTVIVGSSFDEAPNDHPAFPVEHGSLSVWKARSSADRVYVYAPLDDSSECYISVYGGNFSEISRVLGQALVTQRTAFEMKGAERVPNTNSMMVRYDSDSAEFPAVATVIMNAFADGTTPTVQVAMKRFAGTP